MNSTEPDPLALVIKHIFPRGCTPAQEAALRDLFASMRDMIRHAVTTERDAWLAQVVLLLEQDEMADDGFLRERLGSIVRTGDIDPQIRARK